MLFLKSTDGDALAHRPHLSAGGYRHRAARSGYRIVVCNGRLLHRLDQIATGYLAIYYVLAALLFLSYRRTISRFAASN